jgi:hypothetical protein
VRGRGFAVQGRVEGEGEGGAGEAGEWAGAGGHRRAHHEPGLGTHPSAST